MRTKSLFLFSALFLFLLLSPTAATLTDSMSGDLSQAVSGSSVHLPVTISVEGYAGGVSSSVGVLSPSVNRAANNVGTVAVENLASTTDNSGSASELAVPSYLRGIASINMMGRDQSFSRMELYIGSQLVQAWTSLGYQTYRWDTTAVPDGFYEVRLVVFDRAGSNATEIIAVTVDNKLPVAEMETALEGKCLAGSCAVAMNGYDANLENMSLYDGGMLIKSWNAGGSVSYTLDTLALGDGLHRLIFVVLDKAGNSAVEVATFRVDNTLPSVMITNPLYGAEIGGNVTVEFEATDDNLESVKLVIDERTFDVTGENEFIWDTTELGDGAHMITLMAYDAAGNMVEVSTAVTSQNTGLSLEASRNTYLIVGALSGVVVAVVVALIVFRRRKAEYAKQVEIEAAS